MGYSTAFDGVFKLNRRLDDETFEFLVKLSETRRMARTMGPEYGEEGEFYVDGEQELSLDDTLPRDPNIIDSNRPPRTQPSLWCHWIPTLDGTGIQWNEAEKFGYPAEWITYIIQRILTPRGYVLNGIVRYEGEDPSDFGTLILRDNALSELRNQHLDDLGQSIERQSLFEDFFGPVEEAD